MLEPVPQPPRREKDVGSCYDIWVSQCSPRPGDGVVRRQCSGAGRKGDGLDRGHQRGGCDVTAVCKRASLFRNLPRGPALRPLAIAECVPDGRRATADGDLPQELVALEGHRRIVRGGLRVGQGPIRRPNALWGAAGAMWRAFTRVSLLSSFSGAGATPWPPAPSCSVCRVA